MSRLWFQRVFVLFVLVFLASPAMAASFEVTNVIASAQADDAVKARDMAIAKAQRQALATLVGRSEEQLSSVTDAQIARLVRGFSVQGERLAARSYAAKFTIRFNPNATQMFIQSNGFDLVEQARNGGPIVATMPASTGQPGTVAPVKEAPKVAENIIVLPVLDIGTRRVLWDEPNPWREVWQKSDPSQQGLSIRVPLGDISDLNDVPDAGFLSGGAVNVGTMLTRYSAGMLYVIVAKHQPDGMLLSLYRHDGTKLGFLRKMMIQPRAGYVFNDAVPAAVQMIIMAQNNNTADQPEQDKVEQAPTDMLQISAGVPFSVTVPYQSLQQWVGIQKRLRMVQGIRAVMPMRVSPSSAQVKVTTSVTNAQDLRQSMALQNFDLQRMPNGEIVLIEK